MHECIQYYNDIVTKIQEAGNESELRALLDTEECIDLLGRCACFMELKVKLIFTSQLSL